LNKVSASRVDSFSKTASACLQNVKPYSMKTLLAILITVPFFTFGQPIITDQYSKFVKNKPTYKRTVENVYWQMEDTLQQIRSDEYIWSKNSYTMNLFDLRNGKCRNKYVTKYNIKKKNLVAKKNYYCDKKVEETTEIYYNDSIEIVDSKKNLLYKTIHQSSDNSWIKYTKRPAPWVNFKYVTFVDNYSVTTFEYKDSLLISKYVYYKTGDRNDSLIQYDSKNNLIDKTFWTYNNHGDISFIQQYNPNDKWPDRIKTYYEYKYDEKGNWIEKTEKRKNASSITGLDGVTKYIDDWISITKREIYY
jgi:hypothetical protein